MGRLKSQYVTPFASRRVDMMSAMRFDPGDLAKGNGGNAGGDRRGLVVSMDENWVLTGGAETGMDTG
jgi:hypothetical protein